MRASSQCGFFLLGLTILWPATHCWADPPKDPPTTTKFVVRPAAEPSPALRYSLLPSLLEIRPGNAAVEYNKIAAILDSGGRSKEWRDADQKMDQWSELPVEQIPRAEAAKALGLYQRGLDWTERAARMETCDWQLPIRGEKPWLILLPEVQGMRQIARVLSLRARLEIADGKYDEALRTLQTGFAMARHVGQGPTLVNGLVGLAVANIMFERVASLINSPGAPNLYWAIMTLPRPLIDMRPGAEGEMHFIDFAFPKLVGAETAHYSDEEWRALLVSLVAVEQELTSGPPDAVSASVPADVKATALAIKFYAPGKLALIAQGRPAAEVERMPVAQVVVLYTLASYRRLRDDDFKWFFVPYWQRDPGSRRAEEAIRAASQSFDGFPLTELQGAASAINWARARNERTVALHAAVEALRMHAAFAGQLPSQLSDITVAPVPLDPTTGRSFAYTVQGNTAVISSPAPEGKSVDFSARFEITLQP